MIIRTIEELFDLILEARVMLSEGVKMLFVFLFFSFGCLSVNFLEHLNKPHFCGFVAGAFHKEGLGDIDLVWGNKDYGLEHILKRRESDAIDKGMSKEEAKKYALEIINNIPNIISNGKLSKDDLGRLKIEFKNQRVGLNDSWKGETLNNRWVIASYELNQSRNGLIESPLAPNYKGKDTNPLNLDNPNPNTKN
ncbi:hypothetical protein SLK231_05870 [Helicobacter pylori]